MKRADGFHRDEPHWLLWFGVCTVAFALGGGVGTLSQKWAADDELRTLRQQNHELAEDGRKLAAAAYVCMDHCGTHTREGLK